MHVTFNTVVLMSSEIAPLSVADTVEVTQQLAACLLSAPHQVNSVGADRTAPSTRAAGIIKTVPSRMWSAFPTSRASAVQSTRRSAGALEEFEGHGTKTA